MNPFLGALLFFDVGAMAFFGVRQQWAWALIYLGAALIQAGSLWLTR